MLIADLRSFGAGNSSVNPKQLPAGTGVEVRNLDTSQGDFRGMRGTALAHTLTGLAGVQQAVIYRFGRDVASDTGLWMTASTDADYARSMLASDPTERTYITGGGAVPRYTGSDIIGTAPYPAATVSLGVPAPATAMAVTVNTAGTGPATAFVFVDTFLRANLDESAPNTNPTTITSPAGTLFNIASLSTVPGGTHGITLRRIYVSIGGGEFLQQIQQAAATTTVTALAITSTGTVLQTGGSDSKPAWNTPPDDMLGIIPLWSQMHGAFVGKSYMVCVQSNPHAWPVLYRKPVIDTIVGTATYGENWVLATTGVPQVVNGNSPLNMIARPIAGFKQACVAKRSVKSVGHGVCWASNDGLAYHGQLGTKVLTDGILTKAQWRALVPSTIVGASWGRWYIGFYNDGTRRSFMIDTVQPNGIIYTDLAAYGVFEDSVSETLYLLLTGNLVHKWDYGTMLEASFKSAVIRIPTEANPGACSIVATAYPMRLTLWTNGDLRINEMEVFSDAPFRLPGGYVATEFQIRLRGKGPAEGCFIGTEMADIP